MRALLCLSALSLLMPRLAHGQPAPTGCSITCPDDSQHPGLEVSFPADASQCYADEAVLECRCYDRCGGDEGSSGGAASGGTSSSNQPNQGVPPIVTATVAAIALVLVPVYTLEIKRDSAKILAEIKQAEVAWGNHRDGIEELERTGREWQELQRRQRERAEKLARDLRTAAASKPARDLPAEYQSIPKAEKTPNEGRWAAHGYCADVLEAQDEFLHRTKTDTDQESLNALPIPTVAGAAGSVRKAARDGALAKVGPALLQTQGEELSKMSDQLKEYYAFLTALQACLDKPGWYQCTIALAATAPSALQSQIKKVVGKGTLAALEKAHVFATYYKRKVTGMLVESQKLIIAGIRCGP